MYVHTLYRRTYIFMHIPTYACTENQILYAPGIIWCGSIKKGVYFIPKFSPSIVDSFSDSLCRLQTEITKVVSPVKMGRCIKSLFCWINQDAMPTSNFQPIRLLDPDCCYKFKNLMANNAAPDPDQLASSEANWSGSTLFAKAGHIRVQQDKG